MKNSEVKIPSAQQMADVMFIYLAFSDEIEALDETRQLKPEIVQKIEGDSQSFFSAFAEVFMTDNELNLREELGDEKFFCWVFNISNLLRNRLKNEGYM
jgi:hypothetical protein